MEGNEYLLTTGAAINFMDIFSARNKSNFYNNSATKVIIQKSNFMQQTEQTDHFLVLTTNTTPIPVYAAAASSVTPNSIELIEFKWDELCLFVLFCLVIITTVIGNTLVIVAVITTRRLRTVTNCFVTSLAVADWLVGIFVMPPAVAFHFMGSWELGWILCDIWISLDVLLCTASILSLCAISVDRYLAVTQPLNYSRRRRSKRLALAMILIVWVAAATITCPPIFGWYEPGRHEGKTCRYNRNEGYVIFSAMGSFFLPMIVMLYVYVRISCVVAQRHDQLANIETRASNKNKSKLLIHEESDVDRGCSECEEHIKLPVARCSTQPNLNETVIATTPPGHHHHTVVCSGTGSRSLRSSNHTTYSFHSNDTAITTASASTATTPQRIGASPFNNTIKLKAYNSRASTHNRPESLSLDVSKNNSVLTFEPTQSNRVSTSLRRETKTAQTLSIVVGGFIGCWLPFFIYYLITPFLPRKQVDSVLMTFLVWLGWINSAINPFIYAFYSPDFRLAFWRLTFKHCTNSQHRTNFAFQNK